MSETSPAETPPSQTPQEEPLSADVGHDRNEPAEADVSEPDSASDPMPDIAGTGS